MPKKLPKSTLKSENTRRDYDFNHAKITQVFYDCIARNKRLPSNTDLATLSGLSEKTVRNHIKSIDFSLVTDRAKLFAETVMLGLVNRIHRTGDSSAVRLYFQLVFQWKENGEPSKVFDMDADLTELSDREIMDRVSEKLDEYGVNLFEIHRERMAKMQERFDEKDEEIRLHPELTGRVR